MHRPSLRRRLSHRGYVINKFLPTCIEVVTQIVLFAVFWWGEGEKAVPCIRDIRSEEIWLYKYPRRTNYVPVWMLWTEVFTIGPIIMVAGFMLTKDKVELRNAFMSYMTACLLNGAIVNTLKLCAGRPRPDFYFRCFPDGEEVEWSDDIICTGNSKDIIEGRKSFPSGHSSWSFTVMTWACLYISGKLETFSLNGEGKSWKLSMSILPLVLASAIAISRTCDNHHHWQDVTVGSLLGLTIAFVVYRRYYPSVQHRHCYMSLEGLANTHPSESEQQYENSAVEYMKVI